MQNILEKLVHMLPYKISRANQVSQQNHALRVGIPQLWIDKMSSDFGFFRLRASSDEGFSYVSKLATTQNTCIWDTENAREIHQHESHRKIVTVWFAMQANDVERAYYFHIGRVRGIDYHQRLCTYLRSEAQEFTQNSVFQQDGAVSYTTCSAPFCMKCFQDHGSEDMSQQVCQQENCT